mmetsp:Transcript_13056/g.39290  ORF Transcript_13056/g.39290 Transcript_13056/m.39290 type:complete len:207 (+) Transcript_13056:429-1049(+)
MNGSSEGITFFECKDGHGVLCIPAKVKRVHGSVATTKRPRLSKDEVGEVVFVDGIGAATLAYYRPSIKDEGIEALCGVMFPKPIGNSDGTLNGERLFECDPKHGYFVHPKSVRRLSVCEEDVGRLVTVRGYDSVGILRFVGVHKEKGTPRCGVELDHPIGKNDGTVADVEYFTCKQDHGILCVPGKVRLYYADLHAKRVSRGNPHT